MPRRRIEEPDEVERASDALFALERRQLADCIRERRKALGWTQERLAEEARLSAIYVSHLELARINVNPTLRALSAFARALGCRVWDLGVLELEAEPTTAGHGRRAASHPLAADASEGDGAYRRSPPEPRQAKKSQKKTPKSSKTTKSPKSPKTPKSPPYS